MLLSYSVPDALPINTDIIITYRPQHVIFTIILIFNTVL